MARSSYRRCAYAGCRRKAVKGAFCGEHAKHYQQPGEPLDSGDPAQDYRHPGTPRKNNPEAGLAEYDRQPRGPRKRYNYDPHLQPQLVWAGKPGLKADWDEVWEPDEMSFEVDTVSLHIHERVSPKAILRGLRRPVAKQPMLFEVPDLPLDRRVEFYQHDVDWANRLVLGDSLLVMNSLLEREGMAGQVQMIYMDPPYGIKYASNWQPRVDRRDVKDSDQDLTREPEQIRAYRDTWELGVHSYLSYLRDRLLLCRELLADTGSIFVQIGDENVHHVRELMDEVFGPENFLAQIAFRKMGGLIKRFLPSPCDYILWYARRKDTATYHPLYIAKADAGTAEQYTRVELPGAARMSLARARAEYQSDLPEGARVFQTTSLGAVNAPFDFAYAGTTYRQRWTTSELGLGRLARADRLVESGRTLRYVRYLADFPAAALTDLWDDTMGATEMVYAVQTNVKVVERCILMTTDPGDLLLDPTCGSGTTAFCAEKWGRRWITCDTSRVALFIARQRLMTAVYDYYELADAEQGPKGGFIYKTVPHITLESIAHNEEIDEIAAEHQPRLDELRARVNELTGQEMEEWELPRPDEEAARKWSKKAREALEEYWGVWLEKKRRIDESIQEHAPQETLYDQPRVDRKTVRVSGPFTVEAIPVPTVADPEAVQLQPPEDLAAALELESEQEGEDEEEGGGAVSGEVAAGDWVDQLVGLLAKTGITFPTGRVRLEGLRRAAGQYVHAEGELVQNGETKRVGVSFGPPYGPVTVQQVEEALREGHWEYDIMVFAGFAFDPEVTAFLDKNPHPRIEVHRANIAPDVLTGDLLKTTRASQLFTVYGEPEVEVVREGDGRWRVRLRGVDLYDPETGEVTSVGGEEVAAWFLDTDYDGRCFCVSQAFFPKEATARNPWDKLERALKGTVDPEAIEQFRGTESLPFEAGEQQRIAVKVIDMRGNEVVWVRWLDGVVEGGGEKR